MDVLRIAAAFGIMGVHFASHLYRQLDLPLERLDLVNAVDLFFVLSGFLLFHIYANKVGTPEAHWRFLRQRFARLYPLHALTCLMFVGAGYVAVALGHQPRVPSTFQLTNGICHLLLIQAWNALPEVGLNGPSWSLSAEFFLMLIFPALARLLKVTGALAGSVVAIGIAVVFAAIRHHFGLRPWSEATFDFGIFRAVPFFLMGMIVADVLRRHPNWTMPWLPTSCFGLVVLCAMIFGAPQSLSLLTFPALIGLLVLSDRRCSPPCFAHKSVGFLANMTFGIFLLHTIFGILLVVTIRGLGLVSIPAITAMALGFACGTVVAAGVVYTYFEKPMRAWLTPGHNQGVEAPTSAGRSRPAHAPMTVTQRR